MSPRMAFRLTPDWAGWVWIRRGALSMMALFVVWSGWGSQVDGHTFSGEWVWLSAIVVLLLAAAWLPAPSITALAVVAVFMLMLIPLDEPYYGAGWFGVYAVCVDANSRRPIWAGATVAGLVLLTSVLNDPTAAVASTVYVALLAVVGQGVRLAFEGSRAQIQNAELRLHLERAELRQAVHDSGAARLSQLALLARELQTRRDLTDEVLAEVSILADVATIGAAELRHALNAGTAGIQTDQPISTEQTLVSEWVRSQGVLRALGLELADAPIGDVPPLPPKVERELVRAVREVTANICTYASRHGRVVALMSVHDGSISLSWLNDIARAGELDLSLRQEGSGLRALESRIEALGGAFESDAQDGVFQLRIAVPIPQEFR